MPNVINHNISAINTLRNLNSSNRMMSGSLEKLSSGYRINKGSDGPADLVISEQLRAQTVGLQRAVRNTTEASNVIGIAEGALNEMNEILKTMRSLALHAANSGITSPQQVAADQSEIDSSIQTIDRIANTTKYSDQFLLNGNKEFAYNVDTLVKGTQQKSLINTSFSDIDQILKADFDINIAYGGTVDGTANNNKTRGDGSADVTKEAMKAYLEIDTGTIKGDIDTTGQLTASQQFTLTGTQGSRNFSFNTGATVGQIATAISNSSSSTGVDAHLIFASDQTDTDISTFGATTATTGGAGVARLATDLLIFNQDHTAGTHAVANGITAATAAVTGAVTGFNTDGEGRLWVKYTSDTAYELYKSSDYSEESLVATGTTTNAITAQNNSGLGGLTLTVANGLSAGDRTYISTKALNAGNGLTQTGGFGAAGAAETFDSDLTSVTGVNLGENTDAEGKIYIKVTKTGATAGTVKAYRSAQMREEDLVAESDGIVDLDAIATVYLDEVQNDAGTAGTGLGIALATTLAWTSAAGTEVNGEISFDNLGVRVSSADYGSDQYIKLEQQQGSLFQYYEEADNSSPTVVAAGDLVQVDGQDATINVNGTDLKTDGLALELATADVQGTLVFDEGEIGNTTIAQVGYDVGSMYSKATFLTDKTWNTAPAAGTEYGSFLVNAGHKTTEILNSFKGGMQLQLGEGEGDQERTSVSIESMSVAQLGRTEFTGQFDEGKAVIESKTLSLSDVLGGGLASLGSDPIKALSIIDQAIDDVSGVRAKLGAVQKNLLQTNANSLNVAIENITATESDIRDANMAQETTQFTKNQILVQAGTAMLAQANAASQNVLQLLGG